MIYYKKMIKKIRLSPLSLFALFTSLYSLSLFSTILTRKETMLQAAFYTHLHYSYIGLSFLSFFINRPHKLSQREVHPFEIHTLSIIPFFIFGLFFLKTALEETIKASVLSSHTNLLPIIFINSFFALFFCFYFFEKIVAADEYKNLDERIRIVKGISFLFLMLFISLMIGSKGFIFYALTVSSFFTLLITFIHLTKRFLGTKIYAFVLTFFIMAGARLLPLGFIDMKQVIILFFVGFSIVLPTIAALFPKKNTP
jgi:hypothetical protein